MKIVLVPLLIILLFSQKPLQGQKGCDTLILNKHTKEILNVKNQTLKEYLINDLNINKALISNRDTLRKLRQWICKDFEVLIFDTLSTTYVVEIYITKKTVTTNEDLFFNQKQEVIYGNNPFDTILSNIDEFYIKLTDTIVRVPINLYEDLYFPNFCEKVVSINPVEAFISQNANHIHIYMFGEHRKKNNISFQKAFRYSYMAKFILDLKRKKISRIIVSGDKLRYYNFGNCLDFIGF